MINRLNDSFRTDLETKEYNQKQWDAVEGPTIEEIEAFAANFAAVGEADRSAYSGAENSQAGPV